MATPTTKDRQDVSIHWYRNGLRFHDNPPLKDASEQSQTLLPLYVVDPEAPFAQTPGRRAGVVRANFLLESLRHVDEKLRGMGSQLIVVMGKPKAVLPRVVSVSDASALYYEQDPGTRKSDRKVLRLLDEGTDDSFAFKPYATHNLHPLDVYLGKCKGNVCPPTYRGFLKVFGSLTVPDEVETVARVPPLPNDALKLLRAEFGQQLAVPTLEDLGYESIDEGLKHRHKGGNDFVGGEDAGLESLNQMMSRRKWVATFEKPKTSPNALSVDTTGLSPYVKHGCVSPRRFYHELSKVYKSFRPSEISKPPVSLHGQLLWREYNYLMGYSTPNFDKMVGNPVARQIPWDDDPNLLEAWQNSQTGYPFIDAIMTQLRETGWIHHLARHAVACFLTRGDLWQSWEKGAEVFEHYLIDADWSINNFNWQWLSCTAHFYQYFRCYSPVAFGKKTDPNGDYIRKWLPKFKNFPTKFIYEPWDAPIAVQQKYGVIIGENYPHPIVEHKTISKSNMQRMKDAYDTHNNGVEMEEQARRPDDRPARPESTARRRRT